MADMVQRKIPFSQANPETQAFWDAARQGRLLVRTCTDCRRPHWYPRAICPHCLSDRTGWTEASGQGEIYSYSVMRRAPEPYAIAYVRLAEGTTMMTNIVQCDFDALKVGQKVKLVFIASEEGTPVPMFTPA